MIPSYVKDQILEHDIVSIIEGEGIELKRKGANYECCCPFHNEKTPSFKVSPAKNIYKCFGQCDESGNAITFIMHYRNMTYSEALEYLADKLHIQYDKKELTLEERERQYLRNNLIAANKDAQEFFRHSLQNAPAAREYIAKRSWKDSTVDAFGIGYAPGNNSLLKYMTGKGWKTDILMKAGRPSEADRLPSCQGPPSLTVRLPSPCASVHTPPTGCPPCICVSRSYPSCPAIH